MMKFILIFTGGGLGAVARYLFTNLISRLTGITSIPWYTFGVNLLGAFLIGILLEVLALRTVMSSEGKFFLVTGVLGGFTTFSAFSLESALLFEKGDYTSLVVYVVASVVGCITAVFLGSGLVKAVS